ncbi:hypothetical protein ACVINZ_000944 [Mesorhizobium jarvisii]
MKRPKKVPNHNDRLEAAINANVSHLYANGFAISISPSDVTIVLEQNAVPQATLNMSFTVAKTLAGKLGALVTSLEEATGRPILTTDEIESLSNG